MVKIQSTKNNKNFDKMTVKIQEGLNIRVITVANKPELSSWKNNSFLFRPNPFIKYMDRSVHCGEFYVEEVPYLLEYKSHFFCT